MSARLAAVQRGAATNHRCRRRYYQPQRYVQRLKKAGGERLQAGERETGAIPRSNTICPTETHRQPRFLYLPGLWAITAPNRKRPGLSSLAAIEVKHFRQDFGRALAFNLGGASILLGRR